MSQKTLPRPIILAFIRLSRSTQMKMAQTLGVDIPENHRDTSLSWTLAFLSVVKKKGWSDNLIALLVLEEHKK